MIASFEFFEQAALVFDAAVRTDHPGHRTVGIACQDVAAIFDPQVIAILHAAAVFSLVAGGALAQVIVEQGHDPRVIVRVNDVLPGQHIVVQGVRRVAEHFVPARRAIDETGVGVPVPDAIADQFQDGVQHVFVQIRQIELQRFNIRGPIHHCSP
ncbi:hypothetical protein D3C84_496330 [compost metagenome]